MLKVEKNNKTIPEKKSSTLSIKIKRKFWRSLWDAITRTTIEVRIEIMTREPFGEGDIKYGVLTQLPIGLSKVIKVFKRNENNTKDKKGA